MPFLENVDTRREDICAIDSSDSTMVGIELVEEHDEASVDVLGGDITTSAYEARLWSVTN